MGKSSKRLKPHLIDCRLSCASRSLPDSHSSTFRIISTNVPKESRFLSTYSYDPLLSLSVRGLIIEGWIFENPDLNMVSVVLPRCGKRVHDMNDGDDESPRDPDSVAARLKRLEVSSRDEPRVPLSASVSCPNLRGIGHGRERPWMRAPCRQTGPAGYDPDHDILRLKHRRKRDSMDGDDVTGLSKRMHSVCEEFDSFHFRGYLILLWVITFRSYLGLTAAMRRPTRSLLLKSLRTGMRGFDLC
jgi:hypothetical protein